MVNAFTVPIVHHSRRDNFLTLPSTLNTNSPFGLCGNVSKFCIHMWDLSSAIRFGRFALLVLTSRLKSAMAFLVSGNIWSLNLSKLSG